MEFKSFDKKPSRQKAPNECQYSGCEKRPMYTVRFRKPKEYVCYCEKHSNQVYKMDGANRVLTI